ncbi:MULTISPECIES: alpha/beta hydrolase [unclassified Neisseria]|uniref:alpha/beta hydrolase n=1 Tax=unclassified Neisseria TaxID=2623750 RepID=UPI002666EF5E|nr:MULTISPECIES: alpha/beta hydrolase [unclassified Neisseria]MDO1510339.1 alpha/beta hydrolase [Neisseria sp. MVDL19-042950]MDO1516508.1 alpha/beta hydrolase [Neisseria sp. MVDL18-041461]MDO1563699.1 alpha/beta hydrolase [Neisseria sp. MVDL20-010259]
MQSQELEDLTLLLIRDADEPEMWIDRWAVSYPTVRTVGVSRRQSIRQWQEAVQTAWNSIHGHNVAVVAHGAGVSGWLAWLYPADVNMQKRIRNMMLVSPLQSAFPDDECHTLQRVRCHCKTALVIGRHDDDCPQPWAQQQARLWGARLLVSPHEGRLNTPLHGWQWGMKLLQEMLLA